jgi:hypothetical protein
MIMSALTAFVPLFLAGATAVRAGAILPDDETPYLLLMLAGFVVGIAGHIFRFRWMVAVGILMIFLATFLLPIALTLVNEQPNQPGPDVPVDPSGG